MAASSSDNGLPVSAEPVPVMRPRLARLDAVTPYLMRMEDRGIYSNAGPLVQEVERRYARLLGVAQTQVVAASSATSALIGAIALTDIEDWVCPAWTFAATALAIRQAGRSPYFVDVDATSWRVAQHFSNGAEGLIVVLPFGSPHLPTDTSAHQEVVIDAAASLGSFPQLGGLSRSTTVVFSLHATKVLGCGEGGLVVFGNSERAEAFRQWQNFGFDASRHTIRTGTNAKMSEMSAAYALAALDSWAREEAEWAEAHSRIANLAGSLGLSRGPTSGSDRHPYFIVDCGDNQARERVESQLREASIETRRWWPTPIPRMSAFWDSPHDPYPVALEISERVTGLPMYRGIEESTVDRIRAALQH